MKLIFCKQCLDVVALRTEKRSCICGASSGQYRNDNITADIEGPCIPLGFNNNSFVSSLEVFNQNDGVGMNFTAFVIDKSAKSVRRKE